MKRYRVVGLLHKNNDPNSRSFSVYVLVTDSTPSKRHAISFVETDIDEGVAAFQQGWIELGNQVTVQRVIPVLLDHRWSLFVQYLDRRLCSRGCVWAFTVRCFVGVFLGSCSSSTAARNIW